MRIIARRLGTPPPFEVDGGCLVFCLLVLPEREHEVRLAFEPGLGVPPSCVKKKMCVVTAVRTYLKSQMCLSASSLPAERSGGGWAQGLGGSE